MAMEPPLETSAALSFHGVAYVVTVSVRDQTLELQVEVDDPNAAPPSCWTATLPANYVEDLTRKTGNYKRFPVFVNMLLSAMAHRSDAVFIDLLTTADLELYRKRKMGRHGGAARSASALNDSFDSDRSTAASASASAAQNASKRYLILTYAVEFDRVHYPLPLSLVEKPTPEILQRTIRRLRQALANATMEGQSKEVAEEMRALREENRCLKATLKSYCGREPPLGEDGGGADENARNAINGNGGIDLQRELELSMKENKELIGIYQKLREDSSAGMARLKAEIKQLKLGQDNRNSDRDRVEAKRRLNESNAAAQEALLQLQEMKTQLEETQLKNKELLRQLAIARVKAGTHEHHLPASTRSARGPGPTARSPANGPRSAPANGSTHSSRLVRRPNSYEHAYSSDEDDERTNGYRSPGVGSQQRRGFRRFDPTAYQQERQRKLQQRATQRSTSPSQNLGRARRSAGTAGINAGYTSDSSVGGYSSAGSDASKTSRGSARSRGRSRASYQQQREADARLASPRKPPLPDSSFKSPLPRPPSSNGNRQPPPPPTRGRSPSPARSVNGSSSTRAPAQKPSQDPVRRTPSRSTSNALEPGANMPQRSKPVARKLQRPPALLADTSLDSFSDIDDRLTALQQFLKEAKQGGSSISTTTTAAVTAAE